MEGHPPDEVNAADPAEKLGIPKRIKRPRPADKRTIESLREAVNPGEFRRYDNPAQLPTGVSWAGPHCAAVVIAASTASGPYTSSIAPAPRPDSDIYVVRGFRKDAESELWKADDQIYYESADGHTWTVHSKESPDHHRQILSGSAHAALLIDMGLPASASGTLGEYRCRGGSPEL